MPDTNPPLSLTLNGITINYLDKGSGPKTLLFVHGMGASIKGWAKNVEPLCKAYRCIAFDFPNHGDSSLGEYPCDIPFYLKVLTDFISELKLESLTMVGHSMGGMLSVLYAQANKEKIKRLVLLAPAGFEKFTEQELGLVKQVYTPEFIQSYPKEKITSNFHLNFYKFPEEAQFLITDREQLYSDSENLRLYSQTMSRSAISIISTALPEIVSEFDFDCTIIFGQEDKLIPHHLIHPSMDLQEVANSAVDTLGGELILLPNCGHYLMWEEAEAINQLIHRLAT